MPRQSYDVIVVGAGPGGGAVACFLGQAGQRILVLEKERLPRYKPCGGGVSTGLLRQFPFSFDPVIEARVTAIRYALGKRTVTIRIPDDTLVMVMRDQFDAHLLSHARADVRDATAVRRVVEADDHVRVETDDGDRYQARYLIGADGANSVTARSVGLRRGKTLGAAIEAEVPVSSEIMRRFATTPVFIMGELNMGYLWIFPKAQHLSVGIGALHPKPGELQAVLKRVMARYGISLTSVPLHGHPLPIYTGREPIATRRTLLVGDVAGLVDPGTGEGIRLAVKSGRLAAEALLAGQPERYPEWVDQRIGRCHRIGIGVAQLFYHLQGPCFALGVPNPFATRAFLEMLSDRADYLDVVLSVFSSLPLFLTTEAASLLVRGMAGSEARRPGCGLRGLWIRPVGKAEYPESKCRMRTLSNLSVLPQPPLSKVCHSRE